VNGVARLEHSQHLLHSLVLRQVPHVVRHPSSNVGVYRVAWPARLTLRRSSAIVNTFELPYETMDNETGARMACPDHAIEYVWLIRSQATISAIAIISRPHGAR
jgi:hypothetical protein